jgi:hypothetical protein
VAIPNGYALGKLGSESRWLFGGTADVMAPGMRTLSNSEQYIFGLNLLNLDLSYPSGNTSDLRATSDLTPLKYIQSDPPLQPVWAGEAAGDQPAVGKYGWRLRLRPRISDPKRPTEAEYVTAAPFIYDNTLYVSTFTPHAWQLGTQERCRNIGDGKLYALDPMTGASKWKDDKGKPQQSYVLENVKVVGIAASRGKLFLGVKALNPEAIKAFDRHRELRNPKLHANGSVVEVGAADGPKTAPNIEPIVPHLQYWREIF